MSRRRAAPRQLPSGNWNIRTYDHTGRQGRRTFKSHAVALAWQKKAERERDEILAGLRQPEDYQTIAELAKAWLERRPPGRVHDDEKHLRLHLLPAIGELRISELTPEAVDRLVRTLEKKNAARPGQKVAKPLAKATVNLILATLRKFLSDHGRPMRIKYKVPQQGYGWIQSHESIRNFLDECDGWFRVAAAIALYSGLRAGEIAGLRRECVSVDRGQILVAASYDGPTKSRRIRPAPLPPELISILQPWMERHPGPLVVTNEGTPLDGRDDLAGRTRRACRRAGVAEVTFHQLRHTFASHLTASGLGLTQVGAMLGHVSPATTARYAHLDVEALARSTRVHLAFGGK